MSMGNSAQTILNLGADGLIITAECTISNGLPNIVLVGLGGKAVDEAKERIRSAFTSSNIEFPRKRVTINLAPADVPKEGSSLDLAIAVAILAGAGRTKQNIPKTDAFIGELGLDGTIRPVRGIIGKILVGRKLGITRFFIPAQNLTQAELIEGVSLVALNNLRELYVGLNENVDKFLALKTNQVSTPRRSPQTIYRSISEIIGQERAKRGIEIAAAGGHNILLNGPPGTGKTMLAQALVSLVPGLTQEEILEVTHLHSLQSNDCDTLVTERPFRAPHHSASHTAIVGGGHSLRPGEISLSHRGVLFFDEFPEFSRTAIEALRQPMENKTITVTRIKNSATYPADFIFVATSNPCPCGYYGTQKECRCSPRDIIRYRNKLSGPIMDRIDLFVTVDKIDFDQLLPKNHQDAQEQIDRETRQRVARVRKSQAERFGSNTKLNSHMTNHDITSSAKMSEAAKTILNQAAQKLDISARGYFKLIKVARTIADLDESQEIEQQHIAEALQYRWSVSEI